MNVIGAIALFVVAIYLIPTYGHNPLKRWFGDKDA